MPGIEGGGGVILSDLRELRSFSPCGSVSLVNLQFNYLFGFSVSLSLTQSFSLSLKHVHKMSDIVFPFAN